MRLEAERADQSHYSLLQTHMGRKLIKKLLGIGAHIFHNLDQRLDYNTIIFVTP